MLGTGLQAAVDAMQVDLPAKAISFVFHSSLKPDDVFDVAVVVTAINNTTFETAFRGLKAGGQPTFSARFTTICISPKERRAVQVPPLLRERLTPHLKVTSAATP